MVQIPDFIMKRTDISLSEKIVYGWIYARSWVGRRRIKLDVKTIKENIGIPERTSYRALKQLKGRGLISYDRLRQTDIFIFPAKNKNHQRNKK